MLKQDRQNAILELLKASEDEATTTVSIAKNLDVAPMTIRRDLVELEKEQLVTRVYGGARIFSEKTTEQKRRIEIVAKREIGRAMTQLIGPRMTVYLGAGTTIYNSLDFVPKRDDIMYVTNSDIAFHYLVKKGAQVILSGGSYHDTTDEFVGGAAEDTISNYFYDVAFISTNGIWEGTVTTSNEPEGDIQNVAMRNAKKSYLVCDHTKFGRADRYGFSKLQNFEGVITDSLINPAAQKETREQTTLIIGKEEAK